MGIRLRKETVGDIFLLRAVIEKYLKDNNIDLFQADSEKHYKEIQKIYDKHCEELG